MTYTDLRTELKNAMLAKDSNKLSVIRMLMSAINYSAIGKNKKDEEMTESEVLEVILKEIKTRKAAILEFESVGKTDMVSQEKAELEILMQFAPSMMSLDDIKIVVTKILDQNPGIQSGPAMGLVMKELTNKAEPSDIKKIIAEFY